MKLQLAVSLCSVFVLGLQAGPERCWCDLSSGTKQFPRDQLSSVDRNASACTRDITPNQTVALEVLLLALDRRLVQLQEDVAVLEAEDDGELYGVLSLFVVENEVEEVRQLLERLTGGVEDGRRRTLAAARQLQALRAQMEELEALDSMAVVRGRLDRRRLQEDLDACRTGLNATAAPPPPPAPRGACGVGRLANVSEPQVFTAGEYPGSYPYGAWGRDPEPEPGQEDWYWMVVMSASNRFSNFVRRYASLGSLIVGKSVPGNTLISGSNPTTNTVQGPNNVLYRGALYYNCYNQPQVCRFNLTKKTVSNVQLPQGTRYNSKGNFCHLDECYPYTDLDLATDESGVWVTYTTTQDFGNLLLTRVEEGEPPRLGRTWRTSVYKQAVTNTFVACGVLYATRYVSKELEEIFYALDTETGAERFHLGIPLKKMAANIQALNYSPADHMLHAYSDSKMVSYKVLFA